MTHPDDPANASECALCLGRMDRIELRTTVHPDTGHVHLDMERAQVVKCSLCERALHVSCLIAGGGESCMVCTP